MVYLVQETLSIRKHWVIWKRSQISILRQKTVKGFWTYKPQLEVFGVSKHKLGLHSFQMFSLMTWEELWLFVAKACTHCGWQQVSWLASSHCLGHSLHLNTVVFIDCKLRVWLYNCSHVFLRGNLIRRMRLGWSLNQRYLPLSTHAIIFHCKRIKFSMASLHTENSYAINRFQH